MKLANENHWGYITRMKTWHLLLPMIAACALLGGRAVAEQDKQTPEPSEVFGRIQYVKAFADVKVRVVKSNGDLRVKVVNRNASLPGEWEIVDHFPDFKVEIVDAFEDFTIEYVSAFAGAKD